MTENTAFLFIPGLYSGKMPGAEEGQDIFHDWFIELKAYLNLDLRQFKNYPVDGACTDNALVIVEEVEKIFQKEQKKVVLLGYSKGSTDVSSALCLYHQSRPIFMEAVAGFVSILGAFGGSPLASAMVQRENGLIRGLVRRIIEQKMECSMDALIDLTLSRRDIFQFSHPFPTSLPFPVLSFTATIDQCRTDKFYPMFKFLHSAHRAESDGVVTLPDQCVPGSMVVRVQGINHLLPITDAVPFLGGLIATMFGCQGDTHDDTPVDVFVRVREATSCGFVSSATAFSSLPQQYQYLSAQQQYQPQPTQQRSHIPYQPQLQYQQHRSQSQPPPPYPQPYPQPQPQLQQQQPYSKSYPQPFSSPYPQQQPQSQPYPQPYQQQQPYLQQHHQQQQQQQPYSKPYRQPYSSPQQQPYLQQHQHQHQQQQQQQLQPQPHNQPPHQPHYFQPPQPQHLQQHPLAVQGSLSSTHVPSTLATLYSIALRNDHNYSASTTRQPAHSPSSPSSPPSLSSKVVQWNEIVHFQSTLSRLHRSDTLTLSLFSHSPSSPPSRFFSQTLNFSSLKFQFGEKAAWCFVGEEGGVGAGCVVDVEVLVERRERKRRGKGKKGGFGGEERVVKAAKRENPVGEGELDDLVRKGVERGVGMRGSEVMRMGTTMLFAT